jgi:hypothetical protein
VLRAPEAAAVSSGVRERVRELCRRFPLYDAPVAAAVDTRA